MACLNWGCGVSFGLLSFVCVAEVVAIGRFALQNADSPDSVATAEAVPAPSVLQSLH